MNIHIPMPTQPEQDQGTMERYTPWYLHKNLLPHLTPTPFALLMVVYYRNRIGHVPAKLTYGDFQEQTGLSRATIARTLVQLGERGLLIFDMIPQPGRKNTHFVDYSIDWKAVDKLTEDGQPQE